MTVSVSLDNYQTRHCLEDITEHFFDEGEKGKVYLTTAEHVALLTWFKQACLCWRDGIEIKPLLIERVIDDNIEYLEVVVRNPNNHDRLRAQVGGYKIQQLPEYSTLLLVDSESGKPLLYQGLAMCIRLKMYNDRLCYAINSPRAIPLDSQGRYTPLEKK